MKIIMKTLYAGPHGVAQPGQEIDLPEDSAYALIEAGFATQPGAAASLPVQEEEAVVEQATLPPAEQATAPEQRPASGPVRRRRR